MMYRFWWFCMRFSDLVEFFSVFLGSDDFFYGFAVSNKLQCPPKAVVKIRPDKNSGLYGIWTHDLCDTSAALYQLKSQLGANKPPIKSI